MFIGVVLASGFVRKELSFWIWKISFIRETVIFDTSLSSFWTICHELYQTENLRFCQIANNYVTNFIVNCDFVVNQNWQQYNAYEMYDLT